MDTMLTYGEVLEAADRLSLEEQETLVDTLKRRTIELRREELTADVLSARQEYLAGSTEPVTHDDLMEEILA